MNVICKGQRLAVLRKLIVIAWVALTIVASTAFATQGSPPAQPSAKAGVVVLDWRTLATVFSFIVLLLGFIYAIIRYFVIKHFEMLIENTAERKVNEITQEYEQTRVTLENQIKKHQYSIGAIYFMQAFQEYKQKNIGQAINLGERSVEQTLAALDIDTSDPHERLILATRLGNLGYYYAMREKSENKPKAIEFGKFALEVGKEFSNIALIDNYLYIRVRYKLLSQYEINEWIQAYEIAIELGLLEEHLDADEDKETIKLYKDTYEKHEKHRKPDEAKEKHLDADGGKETIKLDPDTYEKHDKHRKPDEAKEDI